MTVNIEVAKTGGENTSTVLRKFSQRVRSSGIIQRMRKIRYRTRPLSPLRRKQNTLRKLARRAEFERLIKEGKLSDSVRGKRGVKWG